MNQRIKLTKKDEENYNYNLNSLSEKVDKNNIHHIILVTLLLLTVLVLVINAEWWIVLGFALLFAFNLSALLILDSDIYTLRIEIRLHELYIEIDQLIAIQNQQDFDRANFVDWYDEIEFIQEQIDECESLLYMK